MNPDIGQRIASAISAAQYHFDRLVEEYEAEIGTLKAALRLEVLTKEAREARIRDLENELAIARAKERP